MNEYFEQWKLSAFVAGDEFEEAAFVGASRLFDIVKILNGLNLTYQNLSPLWWARRRAGRANPAGFTACAATWTTCTSVSCKGEKFSADQATCSAARRSHAPPPWSGR